MGRHKINRPKRVEVTMTEEEYAELVQFSAVLDCTMSDVVRIALNYLAGREMVDPRTKIREAGVTQVPRNR